MKYKSVTEYYGINEDRKKVYRRYSYNIETNQIHGQDTFFFFSGNICATKTYNNGVVHGRATAYNDLKKITLDIYYNNDVVEGEHYSHL